MKRIIRFVFCTYFLLNVFSVKAQYFDKMNDWAKDRHDFGVGWGYGNYNGDLGGLNGEGINYFLFDMEMSTFKMAFTAFHRFNVNRRFAERTSLTYGNVQGSDLLTGNPARNGRNLHFKSKIIEVSSVVEYHIIRSKPGHVYNIKGVRGGLKGNRFGLYAYSGVGLFHFAPRANHGTGWIYLRPLSTEGQGLPLGPPRKYLPVAVSVPIGIGANYLVKGLRIGFDVAYRFTSTDYLDDVSTNYYSPDLLKQYVGDEAVLYANPSTLPWYGEGEQRGDPKYRDGFIFATLVVSGKLDKKFKNPARKGGKHTFIKKGK